MTPDTPDAANTPASPPPARLGRTSVATGAARSPRRPSQPVVSAPDPVRPRGERAMRRTALHTLICIAMGLALSVVIAWGWSNAEWLRSRIDSRTPVAHTTHTILRDGKWWVVYEKGRVGEWYALWRPVGNEIGAKKLAARGGPPKDWSIGRYVMMSNAPALPRMNEESWWTELPNVVSTAYGLPIPCMCWDENNYLDESGGQRFRVSNTLAIGQWEFPYRPLSLGLILNTLFYASLTALLWFTFARTRASLRRRRGLCPNCKYNLRGLTPAPAASDPTPKSALRVPSSAFPTITCPECGTTHRPRASPAAPSAPPP